MNILQILNEIENSPSTNEKIEILKKHKDNSLFRLVVEAALDKNKRFYIKKIPEYQVKETLYDLKYCIEQLSALSNRTISGKAAIDFLAGLLGNLLPSDATVLTRIVLHDLRCGINTKSVNKAWGSVVKEYPHMLAGKDRSKIVYPAIAQLKMDGVFAHATRKGNKIHFYTRKGKEMFIENEFLELDLLSILRNDETVTGEITCFDKNGNTLPRKIIGGIALKAQKRTITPEESDRTSYTVWDLNDYTSSIPYIERWKTLCNRFGENELGFYTSLSLVTSRYINSEEEVLKWFAEVLLVGIEGLVVKNLLGKWVPKRSDDLCKFKAEKTCELHVTSYRYGSGKYESVLGSIECVSEDGLVFVGVGTGFSDKERKTIMPDDILDKIVEIKYNELITDANGKHSLFLPVFSCIRFDKNVADCLNEIE